MDLWTCTCLRKSYFGFPCAHIFAVLIENREDIISKISTLVLNRWQVCQQDYSTSFVRETAFTQFKLFRTPKKINVISKSVKNEGNNQKAQKNIQENENVLLDTQQQNKTSKRKEHQAKSESNSLKKPKNAYFLFQVEVKDEYIRKNPSLRWIDIVKKIAEAYRNLPKDEKLKYETRATEMQNEYIKFNLEKDSHEERKLLSKKKVNKSPLVKDKRVKKLLKDRN